MSYSFEANYSEYLVNIGEQGTANPLHRRDVDLRNIKVVSGTLVVDEKQYRYQTPIKSGETQ